MANQVNILSLNIDTQQLVQRLSQTRQQIDQLQESQRSLSQAGQASSQQFIQQAAQLRNLQGQYNRQLNVVTQLNAANSQSASATQAVNTALNRNITSIAEATENSRQLTAIRNQLNLSTQQGRDALAQINQRLNENTEFIRANVSAQEQQRMNIGNYTDSIQEALAAINPFNGGIAGFTSRAQAAGGAGALLSQSFAQLSQGIMGATRAGIAFIATPIGVVITGLIAAFAGAKAIFDFNMGLQQSNKELKALGVNADEISKVRSEVQATAETFDKDFKDIASKANSLAKAYGISMSEANQIIAEGLASGGAMNDEFLDSIGEYDQLFQKAGFSAQEFINIVNAGYDLGIYADKLPDALKEADLALKEQTKATRDALVNAFGAAFSDDILKKVRTGEMTTKEALDAIAQKSKETQLTQQQQAQLTADIFKGAGEDAGGAMKILEAVSKSATKELDATAKKQLELVDANERLNKAQADLFEVKEFGDIWTSIKVVALDALASTIEYLAEFKKDIQPIIDIVGVVLANAWNTLKTTVSIAFNLIKSGFAVISNTTGTFFNFFKALVTGDFQGAINTLKNGFTNLLNIVSNTFGKIKNNIIDGLKSIVENVKPVLSALGVDVEKLTKKLEGLKSKNVDVKAKTTTSEATTSTKSEKTIVDDKPTADELKRVADEQSKIRAEKQKTADAAIKNIKDEIDFYVAQQGYKKKTLSDELAFEEQLMKKRIALAETEYKAGKISKTQFETQKLNISNEYLKKQSEATVGEAAKELADYKKSIDQKKKDDTFFSEEKLQAKVQENNDLFAKEIEFQTLRRDQGVITQEEYLAAVDAVTEENRLRNEEAQLMRDEAKKEQQAIDLENQRLLDEEKFTNEFDLDRERERIRYEAELAEITKKGGDITKVKKKHAENDKKIEEAKESAVRQAYADTFGQVAQLLGEKTAAGKAAAIAQATINAYEGVTQVWASESVLPEPAATIQKVVSTGVVLGSALGAVKKITGVSVPSRAAGGEIPVLPSGLINNGSNILPLSNGDDTLAYVKQGEVILNEEQQRRAGGSMFFRNIGVPGFAGGGIVGGNTNLGLQGIKIDMDQLAIKIGEQVGKANQNLPSPTVQVDTISEAQASITRIREGANL